VKRRLTRPILERYEGLIHETSLMTTVQNDIALRQQTRSQYHRCADPVEHSLLCCTLIATEVCSCV
jgi:hypothetical protein